MLYLKYIFMVIYIFSYADLLEFDSFTIYM